MRPHRPAHAPGALVVAGLLGGATGSFAVFWIALIALPLAARPAGDMRRR